MRRIGQALLEMPLFNQRIMQGIAKKTGVGSSSFFSNTKFSMEFLKYKVSERTLKITELTKSLPVGRDILYRGTEGHAEVLEGVQSDKLGTSTVQRKKSPSLDLLTFIRDNNSRYFYSTTPCPETATPYATGLSLIPSMGYIIAMGYPKVFTRPQKLLYLNPKMFDLNDEYQLSLQGIDNASSFQSISKMTRNNNEVTTIPGTTAADDWGFKFSQNIMKVVQVCGPGRILSNFVSSNQTLHVKEWENPDFKRRVWAVETVIAPKDDYKKMNAEAIKLGLMEKGQRLITIEDAEAIAKSTVLETLNTTHKTGETMLFETVPSSIPIGDAQKLEEYMLAQIAQMPSLEPVGESEKLSPL